MKTIKSIIYISACILFTGCGKIDPAFTPYFARFQAAEGSTVQGVTAEFGTPSTEGLAGECTRDFHVDRGVSTVGGISLNFAVQARRSLGPAGEVALVSCTGADAAGDAVREALGRAGVDRSHLHTRPGPTAVQRIHLQSGGERHFPDGGYDPGVLSDFHLGLDDRAFIATCDVVVAPYFRQVAHLFHPAMHAARPPTPPWRGALSITMGWSG